MEEKKLNLEVLSDIYKNVHIALQSISNISTRAEDPALKQELLNEFEGYEKTAGKISTVMAKYSVAPKEPNAFKKAMLWGSIKVNTLTDNSTTHIADMMIKGTVMGINELTQILNQKQSALYDDILEVARELLALEESYQKSLKTFL